MPEVRDMAERREIDSVDTVCRIARLPTDDQLPVARAAAACRLDGKNDLRAVLALRKALPDMRISAVIDRVDKSRDIKEYVAEFIVPPHSPDVGRIQRRFEDLIGSENIRNIDFGQRAGALVMNAEGRRRLQTAAKASGVTKRQLVDQLVSGEAP